MTKQRLAAFGIKSDKINRVHTELTRLNNSGATVSQMVMMMQQVHWLGGNQWTLICHEARGTSTAFLS